MKSNAIVFAALLTAAGPGGSAAGAEWAPAPGHIVTKWAAKVDPKTPLPEYPRPQMVRDEWVNLNGLWDYAIREQQGAPDAAAPAAWDGKILVPFPVESALSGVKKPLAGMQELWYRRAFRAPKLQDGGRLLLHFGAVDFRAEVRIDGKTVGEHKGGYDAFSFDITDRVKPGADHELVVRVWDPTGGNGAPIGKQRFEAIAKPGGIRYTPCSGIWQTVWLEPVPAAHIASLRITPDVDAGAVRVAARLSVAAGTDKVRVTVLDGSRTVGKAEGAPGAAVTVAVPQAKLWTPDTPFLYGLRVECGGDRVDSYFGMRKISLGQDAKGVTRILLNNTFVFQSGPLDQGYWPDGIYTAPTDEALRYDIEATKQLGMNMARKHVKIEPARWYYWCDTLGLLVWQDMPSAGAGRGGAKEKDGTPADPARAAQFEAELKAMVEQHINHPSIVMWVVFNEGWGQYDTPRLTTWVKELDPSRLVSNASGWHDRGVGDIVDMHRYPGPGCPPAEPKRAAVLGEFGGLGLPVEGHRWVDSAWGYRSFTGARQLQDKYLDLWREVRRLQDAEGLCAAVYTQTTDCETECNGLLTYDRAVMKVDPKLCAAAILRGEFPPPPVIAPVVPTSEAQPAEWAYTTQKPADDWFRPGFDAAGWARAPAGFGSGQPSNSNPRTSWTTPDIWLRRTMTLPAEKLTRPMFRILHDEDVEVYVNGALAAKATGYKTAYENMELTAEGAAALKPGPNLIAVHCRQTRGGQFIDLGLVDEKRPQ